MSRPCDERGEKNGRSRWKTDESSWTCCVDDPKAWSPNLGSGMVSLEVEEPSEEMFCELVVALVPSFQLGSPVSQVAFVVQEDSCWPV